MAYFKLPSMQLFVALRAEIVGVVFLPTVATVLPHGLEAIAKQVRTPQLANIHSKCN